MAFNPFSSFRRYQKYWMAGAVLVCMLTFVLCSGGSKGMGLDDLFMSYFGGRRGEPRLTINGHKFYYEELNELKNQRNVANDFMRELTKIAIDRLEASIKRMKTEERPTKEKEEQYQFFMGLQQKCYSDLLAKLGRDPRYFQGGTKLEDLVEFILWRDQADKFGIILNDEVVRNFVDFACHGKVWSFDTETGREVQDKVRATHHGVTDEMIRNSLKVEYRVQIAKLAAAARWSPGPHSPFSKGGSERDEYAAIQMPNGILQVFLNTPMQMRVAPTLEEISAQYRKMRTEQSFDLLPVSLEVLAKEVKLPDDPKARLEVLKKFYDNYAKKEYNPNLDTPGFTLPARVEIQFLGADRDMDYFKQPAKVASVLRKTPPVAFNPLSPLTGVLSYLSTGPAWEASLQRNLDVERNKVKDTWQNYYLALARYHDQYMNESDAKNKEDIKRFIETNIKRPPTPYRNSASSWTTPGYYSPGQFEEAQEKPNAETAAALVAGAGADPLTGLAAYKAGAFAVQAKKIAGMGVHDKALRAQVGIELLLAQTPQLFGDGAFAAAALTYYADLQPQFLPVTGYIEKELTAKIEERQAQAWVNKTMLDVKKRLEVVKGRKEIAFGDQVDKLRAEYSREEVGKDGKKKTVRGLLFGETAHPASEYEVDFDENLKPFLSTFEKERFKVNTIEGRAGKPEMLREGDFAKLFFGSEPLGVGPLGVFIPKPWPPYVTAPKWQQKLLAEKSLEQRLFDDAEKPIVFWKSAQRNKEPMEWRPEDPKMLEFVEKQYRQSEARGKLVEAVNKIVAEVNKALDAEGKDLGALFNRLAKENGASVLKLSKVATLVENPDRNTADVMPFVDYALPRERIPYARGDMVKQLLALRSLNAPLKPDLEEADKQNKTVAGEAAAKRAKAELEELGKLNESLFRKASADNPKAKFSGQIQVLTNKPRNVYYFAMVTGYKEPSIEETLAQAAQRDRSQNSFIDQVQIDQGKELLAFLTDRLKKLAEVEISAEARKEFGDENQSQ